MTPHHFLGHAEFFAKPAYFVLEQFAKRLNETELHALRQSADIVMRFDRHRWTADEGHRFNDIRIERSLREEISAAGFFRFGLEHFDEGFADDFALALRILDAIQ